MIRPVPVSVIRDMEAQLTDAHVRFPCNPEEFRKAVEAILHINIVVENSDSVPIGAIGGVRYEPESEVARVYLSSDIVNDSLRAFALVHEYAHIFRGHIFNKLTVGQLTNIKDEGYDNEANAIACLILGEGKFVLEDELSPDFRSFAAFVEFVSMG